MNRGDTIAASKEKWERKGADYYPTPPEVTQVLLDYLALPGKLRIREPCCGEGHMAEVLRLNGHEVTSSDIRHTGYGQGGVDYHSVPEGDPRNYDFGGVVTNPPFSGAERIIRRALRDAPLVGMLLPSDYWHAKSRRNLFVSRPPKAILALTWRPAFLAAERGNSPLANMAWTVWDDKHEGPTAYVPVAKPSSFVNPEMEVTSSIRLGRLDLLEPLNDAVWRRVNGIVL